MQVKKWSLVYPTQTWMPRLNLVGLFVFVYTCRSVRAGSVHVFSEIVNNFKIVFTEMCFKYLLSGMYFKGSSLLQGLVDGEACIFLVSTSVGCQIQFQCGF